MAWVGEQRGLSCGVGLCQQRPPNCLGSRLKSLRLPPLVSLQEGEIMAARLGPESPHTAGKRRSCCGSGGNIVAKFTGSRITGRGFGRGTQVRGGSRGGLSFSCPNVGRGRPGTGAGSPACDGRRCPAVLVGDVAVPDSPGFTAGGDIMEDYHTPGRACGRAVGNGPKWPQMTSKCSWKE